MTTLACTPTVFCEPLQQNPYLFLQLHNLESLKVRQRTPLLPLFSPLCPSALLPFSLDLLFFPCPSNWTSTGGSWKFGDDDGSDDSVIKAHCVTGHVAVLFLGGSVY